MGTIGRETIDILAGIYSDINFVCNVRKNVNLMPKDADLFLYRAVSRDASTLVSWAVAETLSGHPSPKEPQHSQRLTKLTKRLGWKLLSICAHSKSFQQAFRQADMTVWDGVIGQIQANRLSIELFARTRNLEWRGPLLKHARHKLPELQQELAPYMKLYDQHPHHFVRAENEGVRKPMYDRYLQIHIDACTFDPRNWKGDVAEGETIVDPTLRCEEDGDCELCGSRVPCSCLPPDAGQLIELVDYPDKGIGVQALANFKKGDILGEFVGEIRHPDYDGDPKYGLVIYSQALDGFIANISPKRYGNWTRFINHSCDSSTHFKKMIIGDRVVVVIEALRDIMILEEITVDYGDGYWEDRICQCGSLNCISKEGEEGSSESSSAISSENGE